MKPNSQNFSSLQIFLLSAFLFSSKIFTNLPLLFVYSSGTGAPLSALLSGLIALLFVGILSANKKNTDLTKCDQSPLGRWTRYLSAASLFAYLLISSLYTLSQFSQLTKAIAFPTAPLWFISLFFIIAAFCGALGGINGLIQICCYIIPRALMVVFFILISVFLQSGTKNLLPPLGNNAFDTLCKGLSGIFLYSDILILTLFTPAADSKKGTIGLVLGGCALGLFAAVFVITVYTAALPYPLSKDEQLPLYLLMKEVYYGRFFQRSDAVFLLISALWGMFSLSLNLSVMSKILKNVFGIAPARIVLFPLAAIIFFASASSSTRLTQLLFAVSAALLGVNILSLLVRHRKEAFKSES